MIKLLLVEDDLSLIDGLVFILEKNNFYVETRRTVSEAKQVLTERNFDLVLLDISLPDGTGFDICKYIRKTSSTPIIFMTASDEEANIVMGLDLGGDDYVIKPVKLNELISRINALLRRTKLGQMTQNELNSNGLRVLLDQNRVFSKDIELDLTVAEYRLLCLFMQNKNAVLTRELILERLFDNDGNYVDDNTLSVYIRRLRSKIEDNPESPLYLTTVRGMGYRWNVIF